MERLGGDFCGEGLSMGSGACVLELNLEGVAPSIPFGFGVVVK